MPSHDAHKANGQAKSKGKDNNGRYTNEFSSDSNHAFEDGPTMSLDDLDAARSREITAKAVSGVLLLLLKWLKISRENPGRRPSFRDDRRLTWTIIDVLKFEYMTQLLLDSNYLPLILKLFAHQDLDRVVESRTDHPELK